MQWRRGVGDIFVSVLGVVVSILLTILCREVVATKKMVAKMNAELAEYKVLVEHRLTRLEAKVFNRVCK